MAKSDCGLPARSGATRCCISKAERQLREALAYGLIPFDKFEQKYKELKVKGLIWRR